MNKSPENKKNSARDSNYFDPWDGLDLGELYYAQKSVEKSPSAPREPDQKSVRESEIAPAPKADHAPIREKEPSRAPERKYASSSLLANGFDPFGGSVFDRREEPAKTAAPARTEREDQNAPNKGENKPAAKQEQPKVQSWGEIIGNGFAKIDAERVPYDASEKTSFTVEAVAKAVKKQRAPKAKTTRAVAPARESAPAKTQERAPISAKKNSEPAAAKRESGPEKSSPDPRAKNSATKPEKNSQAKNQKNADSAKKFGDPLTPGLPPLTEKEKNAKKRNFLRKVIASLVLFSSLTAGAAMANSAWHDIHSGGAETSRFAAGRNSDFKGNSTNKKDAPAAPAAPELKQWPNIPSTDLNKLATGQQAGAIKMPNGHIVKMVIGNKNQSSNDTNLMSPDTAAVANLGDMSALGQPGVNVGQDHSGYLDENVAFNQLASGESMLGKKFEVTANDGTSYVYEITQRVVVAPEYQGHGTTVIQTNSDGTPRLADPNDPNSVIPIEGAKFFNGETGKFYADPLHPSDKEADDNKSILALSTCAEDEMSKAYHHGLSTHGLRIVSYGALEAVYDKAGNLIAGDGENAITGHTPAQLENIQALDAAAKIANGATNQ